MYYNKINVEKTRLLPGKCLVSIELIEMKKNGIISGTLNDFAIERDRVNHYVGRIIKKSDNIKSVKLDDIVIFSQYAGQHIYAESKKMIKLVDEDNLLLRKYSKKFDIKPKGFKALLNNVYFEYIKENVEKTKSGLILPKGLEKNDSDRPNYQTLDLLKAYVLSVGEKVKNVKTGDTIFVIEGYQNPIYELAHNGNEYATVMEHNIGFILEK